MIQLTKTQLTLLNDINSDPELKYAFDNYEFDTIYEFVIDDPYRREYPLFTLTKLLLNLDIDPLIYVSVVHEFMYATLPIKSVIIPGNISEIRRSAFYNCKSLMSVSISEKVTRIDSDAFKHCVSLESINIPDSVIDISSYAFAECYSLTNIVIPNHIKQISYDTFFCCTSLTSVTIPNNVTYIGYYAFYGCHSLENVTLGDGLTEIDGYAFGSCKNLKNVKYVGTKAQFRHIRRVVTWLRHAGTGIVHCTDGDLVYKT